MESISTTVEAVNAVEATDDPSWRWSMVRVLAELHASDPILWDRAEIVGRWVWIEFDVKPGAEAVRE